MATEVDYGYGEQQDYGYGDAAPDMDYGYGDDAKPNEDVIIMNDDYFDTKPQ